MIPPDYERILVAAGSPGFEPHELVAFSGPAARRKALPPRAMWTRIARVLWLANDLRDRMLARGASGLAVRAVYRPVGGAPRSAHKGNAAIDLDLFLRDVRAFADRGLDLRAIYAEESARLWVEHGRQYRVGLGHYGAPGSLRTLRVHLDTHGCRSWQHAGHRLVKPPSTIALVERLGLALPTSRDTPEDG